MSLLQECMGARGFESDTYFEMALRDVPLIPSLEGSMHINLGLAMQFVPRYFNRPDSTLNEPPSLVGGEVPCCENTYLTSARTGATHAIAFPPFSDAFQPRIDLPNVSLFARQSAAFRNVMQFDNSESAGPANLQITVAEGQCFATIVYGQLVAENAVRLKMPNELTSLIFSVLAGDLSALALELAAIPQIDEAKRQLILQMIEAPAANARDWDEVSRRCTNP
jgi:acyl-CoA dehydrogenase